MITDPQRRSLGRPTRTGSGEHAPAAVRAPVFRFAPSPNGFLHLGHARSVLINADMARGAGGKLLLRIQDIDRGRCRSSFVQAIYEDLDWLGVSFERPVRRQSEHLADYRTALDRLCREGLVYPTFESRAELRRLATRAHPPRDPDGVPHYPGSRMDLPEQVRSARIARGEAYALRIDMAQAVARAGELRFTETGTGPNGEHGYSDRAPPIVGRRGGGPQGLADELPSVRGGR